MRTVPRHRADRQPAYFDNWAWSQAAIDVWLGAQLSAGSLDERRATRLAATLRHAQNESPFYAHLYEGIDDPLARFGQLPVVGRRTLMAAFDDWVTDPDVTYEGVRAFVADPARIGEPFLGRYAVWTSSGTSGEPGIFLHDGHALAVYDALEAVRFRRLASLPAFAAEAIAPARYALVGATGGHFAGVATIARLKQLNAWLAPHLEVFSILQPLAALVRELNVFKPTLMATYPSAAAVLACEQLAGRLRLHLHELWTGGESLSAEIRGQLRHAFRCNVRDDYGASEFLPIAHECDAGCLHVNADWVLLEPVDAALRPVPAGTPSTTVLLTNFANRVQPLVRYDLGDSVTVHRSPCLCGSALPAINVDGRADDTLVLADRRAQAIRILPLALATVIEEHAGVTGFQVLQVDARTLHIRLDPDLADRRAAWGRLRTALAAYLKSQGVEGVRLRLEPQPPHRDARSGKLRQVIRL